MILLIHCFLLLLFLFVAHVFSTSTCRSSMFTFHLSLIYFRFSLVAYLFSLFTCSSSMKDFVYSLILSLFSRLLFANLFLLFARRSSIKEGKALNASYIYYLLEKIKAAKRIELNHAKNVCYLICF